MVSDKAPSNDCVSRRAVAPSDGGAGSGLTVRAIAKRVASSVEVIGIDLNPAMLAEAAGGGWRLVQGNATHFVRSEISDISDISDGFFVAPNSVNAITMVFGIGGIPDPIRCFDQQLRALKPGGIAVLIDIHSPRSSPYKTGQKHRTIPTARTRRGLYAGVQNLDPPC